VPLTAIAETFSINVPEITIGVDVPYAADDGEIEVIVEACFGSETGTTTTGVFDVVLVGAGVEDGDGDGVAVTEGVGEAEAEAEGDAEAEAEGDAEGVGVADADGEGDGDGELAAIVNEVDAAEAVPGPATLLAITVTVQVPAGTAVKV
jgi:hypothetical protein